MGPRLQGKTKIITEALGLKTKTGTKTVPTTFYRPRLHKTVTLLTFKTNEHN